MAIAKKNSACRLSTVVFVGLLQTVCPYRSEDEVDNLLTAMDTESTEENVTQGAAMDTESTKENVTQGASELATDSKKRPGRKEETDKLVQIPGAWCLAGGTQTTCLASGYRNSLCINKECWCADMHYFDVGDNACKACCYGSTSQDYSFGTSGGGFWAVADWYGCESGYAATEESAGANCVDNSGNAPSKSDTGSGCTFDKDVTVASSHGLVNTLNYLNIIKGGEGQTKTVNVGSCPLQKNTECNTDTGRCVCSPGFFFDTNHKSCRACCKKGSTYSWGPGAWHGCASGWTKVENAADTHCR